ncbi:MAG: helix-turn-helix transcriptional regulator [Gammaproteobacteria bacterium]
MHKADFSVASSDAVIDALFQQLEQIRLGHNISQAALAKEAGVSRSTITRMASGENISVDSLVRVMQALGLADNLAALLPAPSVRPVERLRRNGAERRRASSRRKPMGRKSPGRWSWGDEVEDSGEDP